MKIEEKYGELSLNGVQTILNTINNLDNDVTIGELKDFLLKKESLLEELKNDKVKEITNMVGRYFVIKYSMVVIDNNQYITIVHLTNCDFNNAKFNCKAIRVYGNAFEYKENDTIDFFDLKKGTTNEIEEINRERFYAALDAYRNLQKECGV